jgi:hypothetical protein
MKLLLKQLSVSLFFAESKGSDTLGDGIIRAYFYETSGLLLRRKLKKKSMGEVSASHFSVVGRVYGMKQGISVMYLLR